MAFDSGGHGQPGDGPHRQRLALGHHIGHRFGRDGVSDQSPCRLANEDLARRRSLLQARRRVDSVARHERLPSCRVAGDHLASRDTGAGLHGHAALARELGVENRQRFSHLYCRANGSQRVVFVNSGDPEDGHNGVADELLDGPAMPLDDRLHRREVAAHQRSHGLGIELLTKRGGPGNVAEEDCYDLARLARRSYRCIKLRPAFGAKLRCPGQLRATRLAGCHGAECIRGVHSLAPIGQLHAPVSTAY